MRAAAQAASCSWLGGKEAAACLLPHESKLCEYLGRGKGRVKTPTPQPYPVLRRRPTSSGGTTPALRRRCSACCARSSGSACPRALRVRSSIFQTPNAK